jgi:hypothetical protein
MNTTQKVDLQSYTKLPLEQIVVADKAMPDIVVKTPHKGKVVLKMKEEHHPLFGATSQTDKHFLEVLREIKALQDEAKEYLLDEWLTN